MADAASRLMLASASFCDIILRQHHAIASSAFGGYSSPIHRFEKFEVLRSRWRLCRLTDAACPLRVHKVHLHFSNLVSTKNLSPNALAESCGAALKKCAVQL
jgi:hypothetical protein